MPQTHACRSTRRDISSRLGRALVEVRSLERELDRLELEELLRRLAVARDELTAAGSLLVRDEFVRAVAGEASTLEEPARVVDLLGRLRT